MTLYAPLQRGFALISALFLLLVLAAIGIYMVSISGTEHYTSLYALQSAKAYYAARSGIEWAAAQAVPVTGTGNCPTPTTITPGGALAGFSVDVTCSDSNAAGYTESQLNPGGPAYHVYVITATAYTTNIAFGSLGYASRRIRATITDAPPP